MEHAINCASWAFITKIGPMQMTSIREALSSKPATDDTNEDDSTFEEKEEVGTAENTTDDAADTEEFDPADLLGKILALVNQVRSSLQARTYFHKLCQDENLPPLQLLKWVCTCWASLYDLINHLLDMCMDCNKFTLLTDDDDRVPNLKSPKTYAMFKLVAGEW